MATKVTEAQVIESIARDMADALPCRAIATKHPMTVVIEPDHWIAEARRFSRPRVIEAGRSDDVTDRQTKKTQQ